MNYIRAIDSLRKGSAYTAMSEKYEDIIWQDVNTSIPTQKECEDELKRLEEEDKKTQYQRDRASQYPSIQNVVVALAEKQEGDDTMWQEITAQRAKVKSDNPKPE